jgi:hypothetical protein
MLRIRNWRRGLYWLCILTLLSEIAPLVVSADDEVPAGFKPDRYHGVWERNPFTLVTPVAAQVQVNPFDKLILVSWLNDGGKDVVFVQNTETSEVQKVTSSPNANSLRLVEIHRNADPQKADVILSNGTEQGAVKFRLEAPAAAPQVSNVQPLPGTVAGVQGKGALPGMPRQMQMQQNGQQAFQQPGRVGSAQTQQGAEQMQPGNVTVAPRAAEVRRKRITPPPSNELPVGAPAPNQNATNQAPPQ